MTSAKSLWSQAVAPLSTVSTEAFMKGHHCARCQVMPQNRSHRGTRFKTILT